MKCPEHGLERFKIKVVKRFNMHAEIIEPRFRSRPKPGELSCIYVGRSISEREVREYLIDYLHRKGLWEKIVTIKFSTI